MKKTNDSNKSDELNAVFTSHFQAKINLARIKLISYFIIALCKVQTVTFENTLIKKLIDITTSFHYDILYHVHSFSESKLSQSVLKNPRFSYF